MDFVLFLVFVAIGVYNISQVGRSIAGKRPEKPYILFFLAFAVDIYYAVRRLF
jgi:hypothetical protein